MSEPAPPTVITEPKVYLVGHQRIDARELDRFLIDEGVESWETDTEVAGQKLVECAGRLCYKSYAAPRPGGNAAYIGHILEVGHGSVLEHAVFNLIITGVSRSFSHELVRHRAGFGYSQLSQRFVDESGVPFVVPPAYVEEVRLARAYLARNGGRTASEVIADSALRRKTWDVPTWAGLRWLRSMERAREDYAFFSEYGMGKYEAVPDKTLRRKKAREAARSVLPNATETQIFVTGNARALRHFVEMRGDAAADAEIRRVALAVLALLAVEAPNLFGDYTVVPTPDAADFAISTPHRKV